MEKKLLLKYLEGNATSDEVAEVFKWVDRSEKNRDYLMRLKMTHLIATIPESPADEVRVGKMMSEIKQRSEVKRRGFYRRVVGFSVSIAAAAVIACVGLAIYMLSDSNKIRMKENIVAELTQNDLRITLDKMPQDYIHEIYTERGVKSSVVLPDSSIVLLNSDTKIVFPDKFAGSTREVFLDGEAYFKVKSDSLKPMIVKTANDFEVKVVGTEFNLKAFKGESEAEATLYSGKIDLVTPSGVQKLRDIESVVINNQKVILPDLSGIKINNNKAWTEGKIIFDETSMKDVITTLERWHGVDFIIKDPNILKYRITATFNAESISQIMYVLFLISRIDYNINDNIVTLTSR